MKLYELINENSKSEALAFLLYYEKSASYIIEINSDIEEKDLPLILSSFFNKGIYTVDPNWSEKFVETRIIPRDRQNLSSVLQRYGLKEYNTGKLLDLSKGRCAQDDCAILPSSAVPDWLKKRQKSNIREAVFLHDMLLMMECEDDQFYFTDLKPLILNNQRLCLLLGRQLKRRSRNWLNRRFMNCCGPTSRNLWKRGHRNPGSIAGKRDKFHKNRKPELENNEKGGNL